MLKPAGESFTISVKLCVRIFRGHTKPSILRGPQEMPHMAGLLDY